MKKIYSLVLSFYVFAPILIAQPKSKPTNANKIQVKTPQLLNDMKQEISPCENFYEFAVGKWVAGNPVPKSESSWSSFNLLTEQNNERIQKILNQTISAQYKPQDRALLVQQFYKSALDTLHIEKHGRSQLKENIDFIAKLSNTDELFEKLPEIHQLGANVLFRSYVGIDSKNAERYVPYFSQGGLGLPDKDYYMKEDGNEIIENYKKLIDDYLRFVYPEMYASRNMGNEVFLFEKKLAEFSLGRVDLRDPEKNYNKVISTQLAGINDRFNMLYYAQNAGIANIDDYVIGQPDFLKNTLNYIGEVDFEVLKAYTVFHAALSLGGYSGPYLEQLSFNFFSKQLRGTKEMKPKHKRILETVNGNLGEIIGELYVEQFFSEKAKKYVEGMIEDLRDVYRKRIQNLDWMSTETKAKALEKLNSFTYKIGYPNKWREYNGLILDEKNFLKNAIAIRKFNKEYNLSKLGKPIDKDEWGMTPQTVNAYYNPTRNEIVFPAGILQAPFFSIDYDAALNYGGIGGVIGHEFTHGFDDKGSKYDAQGNLNNWWTEKDREKFDAKTKILAEQFDAIEVLPGVKINGKLTLGENIADLGGLTLAYYALEQKIKDIPELGVSYDGFTWQQRFYINWAQVWKNNITNEALAVKVKTDPHSPGKERVLMPLSNLPEFRQAFGCKESDLMINQTKNKVNIW
jgi:putative endopeptidase